jgi:competence protein ComEA
MARRFLLLGFLLSLLLAATGEARVKRMYTGTLNINTASAADFGRLPRIGEVIAYRIVKAREQKGGQFASVGELRRIKGISERVYTGLKPYVSTTGENDLRVFLDLNTATRSLLLGLPGATAEEARSILNYRRSQGRFIEVEDLHRVPGISDKRYGELAEWLTVAR